MAYQVDKFNGTFLVSVDDGTIDTTTDLRFVKFFISSINYCN